MRFLCILGISLMFSAAGQSQSTGRERIDFRGHVQGNGLESLSSLTVQLRDSNAFVRRAPVFSNGDFEFAELPSGEYTASLIDLSGDVLWQDFISIREFAPSLIIRLPERRQPRIGPGGTVSVHALEHKVPKDALKEYRAGRKAFDSGDYAEAVEHLQKALQKDPAYVDAYNDLAAAYSHMGRQQEALDELHKAYEIDPDSVAVNLNLAAAMLRANQFAEAEKASRHALDLNPNLPQADVILGVCLDAQNHGGSEALFYLLRGADRYPEARLTAARILANTGKRNEALEQLKKYLETNRDPKRRRQVEQWMAKLQ
jgi:tetratricopeptide (TPR) repeat protein